MSTEQPGWDAQRIFDLLSEERMETYRRAAHGDLDAALTLYSWNMDLAASLQRALAMVEVVARNSMDRSLVSWCNENSKSANWFSLPVFDARTNRDIEKARTRVRRSGAKETHGKVIAELPFGFWRFLASRRYYASLWVPAIHKAFPNGNPDVRVRQYQVVQLMEAMNMIRNRVAHLEPLFQRDIQRDIEQARLLLRWIDLEALAWFDDMITVEAVMRSRPEFLK